MQIFINAVKGDFKFAEWEEEDLVRYRQKIHELRMSGYKKIGQDCDYLNQYEYYRNKKRKKTVTVTILCC